MIDNLLRAVKAADEQCKRLEYWSDVKGVVQDGETFGAPGHEHGWDHGWQGVDASGPPHPAKPEAETASENGGSGPPEIDEETGKPFEDSVESQTPASPSPAKTIDPINTHPGGSQYPLEALLEATDRPEKFRAEDKPGRRDKGKEKA